MSEQRASCRTTVFVVASIVGSSFIGGALFIDARQPECKLTYEHNTVITEEVLLRKAANARWPIAHPKCNKCANATDVPVWIAPGDLCRVRPALQQTWEFCEGRYEGTEFADDEHVKVCVSRDDLTTMWDEELCHLSASPSTDDWFALVPDNKTLSTVNVGYDGTLFCTGDCSGSTRASTYKTCVSFLTKGCRLPCSCGSKYQIPSAGLCI